MLSDASNRITNSGLTSQDRRTDAKAKAPILWPPDVNNWKRPLCWETLKAKGIGENRGWDDWMVGITDSMDMNLGKLPEILRDREAWHAIAHGVARSWT